MRSVGFLIVLAGTILATPSLPGGTPFTKSTDAQIGDMIGDIADVVERNAAGLAEGSTEAHHAESSSLAPLTGKQTADMNPCPICLEDIPDSAPTCRDTATTCGHRFHPHCISVWREQSTQQRSTACPICFQELALSSDELRRFRQSLLRIEASLREASLREARHRETGFIKRICRDFGNTLRFIATLVVVQLFLWAYKDGHF